MSLLSSLILPQLEKELVKHGPEIAAFMLDQIKTVATDVIRWAETKTNVDINKDGQVGAPNE